MTESGQPNYRPGENIAVKVPAHEFAATVAFYRETLGFPVLRESPESVTFDFAGKCLWIDRVAHLSHAETWLEIRCDDAEATAEDLAARGVQRCDAVEPLPDDFKGFWVLSPAGQVHLVAQDDD